MPANVRWSTARVRLFVIVSQLLLASGPVGCGARSQLGIDERRPGCEPGLKSEELCNGVDDRIDTFRRGAAARLLQHAGMSGCRAPAELSRNRLIPMLPGLSAATS